MAPAWGETGVLSDVALYLPTSSRCRIVGVCKKWLVEASRASLCRRAGVFSFFSFFSFVDGYGTDRGCARLREMLTSPRFAAVEEVNFECCKRVTDAELEALATSSLRRLNLNALHNVSPPAVEALIRRSPKLEALQMYWHPRLPDSALAAVGEHVGTSLTELNLSGCGSITDKGIEALLARCTKIARLDVTRCPKLTDASLRRVADTLGSTLLDLNCYANAAFTDEGYGALAISANKLERLDTCGARYLSSPALAAIARLCGPSLTSLNCSWCVALTDEAGVALAKHAPRLQFLSFHGILAITDVTIDALAKAPAGQALHTLDVNGCAKVTDYRRRDGTLVKKFPNVTCWLVHR